MSLKSTSILSRYLPIAFVPYVTSLLRGTNIRFRIVKPRKTKLGDFKVISSKEFQITVNGDLNKFAFLITTLHEIAHWKTYEEEGRHHKPHGIEWKNNFSQLLSPLLSSDDIPNELRIALKKSILNVKASSCTDPQLYRVLSKFDENSDEVLLESLSKNSIFELAGKQFRKGNLRRSRFECSNINNQRTYLVSSLAKVKPINNEQ